MYSYGLRSMNNLDTCDPRLISIFMEVIRHYDCSIIEGYRSRVKQDEYFHAGKSKLKWPHSKHNKKPSLAVDAVPYFANRTKKIDWEDKDSFYYFAGIVKGIAVMKKIPIIWGGDWDNDNDLQDQSFHDLPHFELVDDYRTDSFAR